MGNWFAGADVVRLAPDSGYDMASSPGYGHRKMIVAFRPLGGSGRAVLPGRGIGHAIMTNDLALVH
jgi:hypothetical protein